MNEFRKEKNLNYGVFSPKFETYRRLKLGKSKIQNYKYCKAILGSPSNFNSSIKYHKNRSTYFSPDYTNNLLSPIHKNRKRLKKCCSQKNITERPTSFTSRSFPTVINNFRGAKSPVYKTTGNNNILYDTSNENTSNFFNLETEKLYQETRQIRKVVKFLTKELLKLKKENEEKDRQITIKEKEINNIIIKNNSLLGIVVDTNEGNKNDEYSTNNSYISNNKTETNSNIFNDSIYLNALSSNRNSSTGNLFFRIKKEIKQTNNETKLENDKFERLKKSLYITKMNELTIESNMYKSHINKINSLLENALIIKRNNNIKKEELLKVKLNIEMQEKIENNLSSIILKLENKENDLRGKLEMDEYELINKTKEVNININKLVILKKKNENLNKDKVIKNEIYINPKNGNQVQINTMYKNKIRQLKKSIKFYERKIKYSEEELTLLKERRNKLIETEKIKGLKLNIDINNKEKEEIKIIKKGTLDNNNKYKYMTDEEKIKYLKEIYKKSKDAEKMMEEKIERYNNKLNELELIEMEKAKEKEENNQNQSQIEFGIDNENPFYTEDEKNFPEISFKFTSSQFNQFTYVLFKNFEAKGIVEDTSKNKIIDMFYEYMKNNNISIIEYNSSKFKEVMEEFTKIIMTSLNNTNTYNYTLVNIFISALFYNSECDIKKLIKYFNILFSYTRNYSIEEEKYIKKLKTKYNEQTKKLINCIKNYLDSNESDNKEYFQLLKMKEILDKNKVNLKDKYIEFLFYYLKKFDDPKAKLSDLKFDLFYNIIPKEKEKKEIEEENSENNDLNYPIKDSEIKDINNSSKNEDDIDIDASKKESNFLDILDKKSNINLTSQKNEMKSPTEEDFSKRQKRKKKNMEKKSQKKEEKENSDDFEEEEDSMTEITNEEYIKQLTEALKIMQKGLEENNIKFEDLMSNVVQKRKITGLFYECISIEDFNDQFKSINIILSDLKLSCLCSKYSIPNELRLIDKNKLAKDIEKQEKGILKFNEDDDEEED
jgi:hypothetical protein